MDATPIQSAGSIDHHPLSSILDRGVVFGENWQFGPGILGPRLFLDPGRPRLSLRDTEKPTRYVARPTGPGSDRSPALIPPPDHRSESIASTKRSNISPFNVLLERSPDSTDPNGRIPFPSDEQGQRPLLQIGPRILEGPWAGWSAAFWLPMYSP